MVCFDNVISLKRNILTNYISQLYVTTINILMLPLYLRYMGAEAYGLVGFFMMLQMWFNLLDMGLTPTIARETARFRGGKTNVFNYRSLVWILERIFLVVAAAGCATIYVGAGYIANDWLKAVQLPIDEIRKTVQLIAVIVAMRWMCGLYRGVVSGFERLVWLGGYNSLIATLRFVGVLLVLKFIGVTPTIFFAYQLCLTIVELTCLLFFTRRLLPSLSEDKQLRWSWATLKPVFKFSLTIAFTSSAWVLVTQTDKLVLSRVLPLAEYGYFTLAVLVANGVVMISGPVSGAIMPRMTKLEAEGNHAESISVYRKATQLVSVISGTAFVVVAFYAEPLLWVWTGDHTVAHQSAPVLTLYAIGNGILAVAAFPYYLQYARGKLKLHLMGSAGFVVILIPSIIWAASLYGGVGAGYAWLTVNAVYLMVWVPLVHKRLEPGLNTPWFGFDVLTIYIAATAVGYGLAAITPQIDNRWYQAGGVMIVGLLVLITAVLSSSMFWERIKTLFCSAKNE